MKLKWTGKEAFHYHGEFRASDIHLAEGSVIENPNAETADALLAAGWVNAEEVVAVAEKPKTKGGF